MIYATSIHKMELSNLTKNEIVLPPKQGVGGGMLCLMLIVKSGLPGLSKKWSTMMLLVGAGGEWTL